MHRQRPYRVGLALGALAVTLFIAVVTYHLKATSLGNPMFSRIKESDIVSGRVIRKGRDKPIEDISVSPSVSFDILAALIPNRIDTNPLNWQVLGSLHFKLTDGRKYFVDLYRTDEEEAAFSMDRVYYRGGSEAKLVKLIREAEGLMEEENKAESGKTLAE